MVFCVWLLSLGVIFSKFIHAVACEGFVPSYGSATLRCMDTLHFFIHSSASSCPYCPSHFVNVNNSGASQKWGAGSAGTSVCNSGGLCPRACRWNSATDAPAAVRRASSVPAAPPAPNIITLLQFYQSDREKHTAPQGSDFAIFLRSEYLWGF